MANPSIVDCIDQSTPAPTAQPVRPTAVQLRAAAFTVQPRATSVVHAINYTTTAHNFGLPFWLSCTLNDQIELGELEQAIKQTKRYALRMALITAIAHQSKRRDFSVDRLRDAGGLLHFHDGLESRHLCALGVMEI